MRYIPNGLYLFFHCQIVMPSTKKTRFRSLSKKDRDEVVRLHDLNSQSPEFTLQGIWESYIEVRADPLDVFFACPPRECPRSREAYMTSELLTAILHAEMSSSAEGMIRRLIDDDPPLQAAGFSLAARFSLLYRRDYAYIYGVLMGLAARDDFVVARSLDRFPSIVRRGHPSSVLLCEAVCAVLRRDRETFADLEDRLRARNDTRLFRAMYDCLLAIMAHSREDVGDALAALAVSVRRKRNFQSSMERIVCYEAHALFNLAVDFFKEEGIEAPTPPAVLTWDSEFQQHVDQNPIERNRLVDLAAMSPTLHSWVEELSEEIPIRELLLETSRIDDAADMGQSYSDTQLQRLSRDAEPFRGDLCPACKFFIPRFDVLDEVSSKRIRSLDSGHALEELMSVTGCPVRFAGIWLSHPDGPRKPPPLHLPPPPCPHCGKKLATSLARQCLHCGADWH